MLVENEIGHDWETTNHHNLNLRHALVEPRMITVIERTVLNGEVQDRTVAVWVILIERSESDDGYRIVMKANEPTFGLASKGFAKDKHLVLCGWYGDFLTTFRAM